MLCERFIEKDVIIYITSKYLVYLILERGYMKREQIIEKLKSIDVNTLTPIEAMTVLFELQKSAENL